MAVSTIRRARFLGTATAFVAAGAAAIAIGAPANAAVTSLTITTPSGYGSVADRYGSGCTYTVEATINNAQPQGAVQYIISDPDGVGGPQTTTATGTKATFEFAPTKTGKYTIRARQADNVSGSGQPTWVSKEVQVRPAIQTPSTGSVDLPYADSCIILTP